MHALKVAALFTVIGITGGAAVVLWTPIVLLLTLGAAVLRRCPGARQLR